MAATDQTLRNQKVLNIVFGVTSLAMFLSVIVMMWQDYDKEWKPIQRKFRDVETGVNERFMLDQLPSEDEVKTKLERVKAAREALAKAHLEVDPVERSLSAERSNADNAYRMKKAEFDSKMSYFDIATNEAGDADTPGEREKKQKEREARLHALEDPGGIRDQLAQKKAALDAVEKRYREQVADKLVEKEKELGTAEDDMKKTAGVFDRFGKTTAQKKWGWGDSFRALPIIDGFKSPTSIQQIKLSDLTIDYNFKEVPRFDRCQTCHLGIDRATFSRSALTALTTSSEALAKKLETAHRIYAERQKSGEDLGFDPSDIPSKPTTLKLTKGEITQYMSHPRLDLFVDANSPHPMQQFGCTPCHAGQGSSTEFILASHTPNDFHQKEEWTKAYDWESVHFWDYPMHPTRFVESGCVKCHHQMTDLIRYGVKEEAPKVLQGYALLRENGCFGCHEIAGTKGGRSVGPDMRLEPAPALEWLSQSERERVKGENPGNLRKVGPSLRRIAEKTNEEWTRKWIQAPRDFREDTKMPHFYGLSNNAHEALEKNAPHQNDFPEAEIHSIAYYLFSESNKAFEGQDTYRLYLIKTLKDSQAQLVAGKLSDVQRKELSDTSRAFGNLALLSVPMKANDINARLADQKAAQDRLAELQKQKADLEKKPVEEGSQEATDVAKITKEMSATGVELDKVTTALIDAAKAEPLKKAMIDSEGSPVSLAALPKADADNGRRLFTEKGCLACHANDGTMKADKGFSPLESHANFGPNLTRIAAKLGNGSDADAKKRWLVQWILNPNVHHPRTRMPVTFLKPEEANDVAEWLLSQPVTDYDEKDPGAPAKETLVALARVYLGKVKEMTEEDVETILPRSGSFDSKKAEDRLQYLKPDADEQILRGEIDDGKLKWYIGRKSISRLGCYGCHDVPGFETAKPIGTALNDWGKKDPERLAFEDADSFVKSHFNIAPLREPRKQLDLEAKIKELSETVAQKEKDGAAADDEKKELEDLQKSAKEMRWETKDGKKPYDKYFFESLEHHHRDGFLNQKLIEPRSYDYGRIRSWDDRLRMPQFQFARTRKHTGESDEDFAMRKEVEEADAREALMTFVFGLVAEPVPLKYVNHPTTDREAEVKGRHVLDKFNCAGCHQVHPGRYEFKSTPDAITQLTKAYDTAKSQYASDHYFPEHNAWAGKPSPFPDRMVAFGVQPRIDPDISDRPVLRIRLADALRFTGADGVPRDLRAASQAFLIPEELLDRNDQLGGIFPDLVIGRRTGPQVQKLYRDEPLGYLAARYEQRFGDKPNDARSALPPPLVREGERVQPRWLYQFLLDPQPVRPQTHMILRMPRFNMSSDEAMALVNYFGATAKLDNPDANLTYPYLTIDQRDSGYWRRQSLKYAAGMTAKDQEERFKALEPAWKSQLQQERDDLEARRNTLKKDVEAEKSPDAKKVLQDELTTVEANFAKVNDQLTKNDLTALRQRWKDEDAYASDAYRLLLNKELCQKCHDIGKLRFPGAIGPNLDMASERLRPDWTLHWLANPVRMITYDTQMPQNFGKDKIQWQESFHGAPLDQVKAVRDALMDLPRLADMPVNRPPRTSPK